MCGIAGVIGIKNIEKGNAVIEKMTTSLAHRGPDAADYYVETGVAFGHRRLSIIDLSSDGTQPFRDVTGRYTLVFNGEIYNYQELKSQIDYDFKTSTDTEVLMALLIKKGIAGLNELNGMFAFAFWDEQTKELICARDRMGIKPFFYSINDNQFLFSSEVRSILQSGIVEKKLSKRSLEEFLLYQTTLPPRTLIEDILQLSGGEVGVWKNNEFSVSNFWKMENTAKKERITQNHKAVVKDAVFSAVEKRLISDVPLGAFLSGGIDSSAIVAVMDQVSTGKVNTFSVVFEEKEFDESPYSDLISKKYKTDHHKILLKSDVFKDELIEALDAMDQPSGDGINSYVICKETKKAGLTVALSGLGGDEIFTGYSYFHDWKKLNKYKSLWSIPQILRKNSAKLLPLIAKRRGARLKQILSLPEFSIREVYPPFRQVAMLDDYTSGTNNGERQVTKSLLKNIGDNINDLPLFSQFSIVELKTYTQNVLLKDTDQMSMASSLEVRVPFLDHELVETLLRIPDHLKHKTYPKDLLVECLDPLVPGEIVHRPKMGFTLPWKFWLKNELRSFCEERINYLKQFSYFDAQKLESMWEKFCAGDETIPWVRVWQMVVLSYWLKKQEIEIS